MSTGVLILSDFYFWSVIYASLNLCTLLAVSLYYPIDYSAYKVRTDDILATIIFVVIGCVVFLPCVITAIILGDLEGSDYE